MLREARRITAARDAKLRALREVIAGKCARPINPGNRKVIVFTAFADTPAISTSSSPRGRRKSWPGRRRSSRATG